METNRRSLLKQLAAAAAALWTRGLGFAKAGPSSSDVWEYVVIGSGAGGGTVAARLVELGHSVFVLEAGADPMTVSGGNALYPNANTVAEDYEVPAFHPNSTENDAMKWDFFVRHYSNDEQQRRDRKYRETWDGDKVDGVLYPRAGTLGGCTAHNAMIMVYPHNEDWQNIADLTGDPSWAPEKMRKYFEKLENCHHRPVPRFLHSLFGINATRHGFSGWLRTEKALPLKAVLGDQELSDSVLAGARTAIRESGNPVGEILHDLENELDPNDWRAVVKRETGIRYTPLTTNGHQRMGTRERLLNVQRRFPGRLHVETDALATKILFEGQRAVGVEYRHGRKLYRTHGTPSEEGEPRTVRASREIIVSGGAFNTPQLLMLSGIGPRAELDRFGIRPVKILDGVGKHLQDRYEVGVVHSATKDFTSLDGAEFKRDDAPYKMWKKGQGVYTTNGAALAVIHQSPVAGPLPDLFCFALIGDFRGYYPTYSKLFKERHNCLTWAILKAHTLNQGGEVTLKSADPRVAPHVNFHYFEEGTDKAGKDLDAVVAGIKFVRTLTRDLHFLTEEVPGPGITSDDDLRAFVRDNAWGHHASCTCKIGPESEKGVVDSNFCVHGVTGLRVVDASIFPRIPGFFIVSSIYIAAEKAASVIHAAAKA